LPEIWKASQVIL
jgi:hypothetical protein